MAHLGYIADPMQISILQFSYCLKQKYSPSPFLFIVHVFLVALILENNLGNRYKKAVIEPGFVAFQPNTKH